MGWTPPGERRVGSPGQQQDNISMPGAEHNDEAQNSDSTPFAVVSEVPVQSAASETTPDLAAVFADAVTPLPESSYAPVDANSDGVLDLGEVFATAVSPDASDTADTTYDPAPRDISSGLADVFADTPVVADENSSPAIGLGDVFAEQGEAAYSADAQTVADLGDLFGDTEPAADSAAGLGDLFVDTVGEVPAPLGDTTPDQSVEKSSSGRRTSRAKRTLRLGDTPPPRAPVPTEPVQTSPVLLSDVVVPDVVVPDVSPMTAAATLASVGDSTAVPHETTPYPAAQPVITQPVMISYFAYDRLWPTVEAVLRVVQQDAGLQSLVTRFELTRDPAVDIKQKHDLVERLRPAMAVSGVNVANPDDITGVFQAVYDELLGISVLGQLWRDDSVTEIMVDGWDRVVIERDGGLVLTPLKFRDANHAGSVARELARRVSGRALSLRTPLVTAELPKARVTFAVGGVVRGGLSITMRKHRMLKNLDELLALGALNQDMSDFLRDCVLVRAGVLVSGGTGTGKTTIINLLSSFIPDSERVITIEDSFELQLANTFVVSLQTKESASADDEISITMADLMRNSLRMRPDRIIVGEIREAPAAVTMLAAATTGHDGTMTTIHAPSPSVAVNERLADMLSQSRGVAPDMARRTVTGALQLVVQVTRGRHGGRYISEISVIDRSDIAKDGLIVPESIFIGEEDMRGQTRFRRVSTVRNATELGSRFASHDITRWSA